MKTSASSTCTLPPLSDLLITSKTSRKPFALEVHNLLSPISSPTSYDKDHRNTTFRPSFNTMQAPLKAKRKRASPSQLSVLNHVFDQTYFPSTELRVELGKQLGMSPRAIQIWFQNKRQSLRSRERQQQQQQQLLQQQVPIGRPYSTATAAAVQEEVEDESHGCRHPPPISPPLSPLEQYAWQHHQQQQPPTRTHHIALPPLQPLPSIPSRSSYPSPTSIDATILH